MSTDTSSAVNQPTRTAPTPKPPQDKVVRITTMTKQLLDEVRTQTLDTAGLSDEDRPAIRSACQTLITAVTKRIAQQRLTAAQAAAILHLTGPRVTQLLQANIDEFTLDELVNLLPALQLTIQIAPAPAHDIGNSGQKNALTND